MGVLLVVLASWLVLSLLGLLGTAAVCRAGHVEDVARGFADADPPVRVPVPRAEQAPEVTRR